MLALIEETKTDGALKSMLDQSDDVPLWPRWLHFSEAAAYLGLKPGTLSLKLRRGIGPKFHLSPGSRDKIFFTGDLDAWVRTAPERALTQAEIERRQKLQAGAERAREEKRARRRAGSNEEEVNA